MPSAHSQHKGNHKGRAAEGSPPPFVEAAEGRLLCVGCEHWAYLNVEMQDMCLVESQDICLVETQDMCLVSFVLALSEAHVLALNKAHVFRLNKADVFAFDKAQSLF